MTSHKSKKSRVAALSVMSNSMLVVFKLFVGLYSGAVSILSEAIHSGVDLIAALIAFFAVRASGKPADDEHTYGHGKFENLSAAIEGLLISLPPDGSFSNPFINSFSPNLLKTYSGVSL